MLRTVSISGGLPVSLDEAKEHCRVEDDLSDGVLTRAIKAATEYVQERTGLILRRSTLHLTRDSWWCSDPLTILAAPIRDVSDVVYLDGEDEEVAVADFTWQRVPHGAELWFPPSFSRPSLSALRNNVTLTIEAGFDDPTESGSGDDPELALPSRVQQAMLLLISHWNEHREAVSIDPTHPVAIAVDDLLAQLRIYR